MDNTLSADFLAAIDATVTRPLMLVAAYFHTPIYCATREVVWSGRRWSADRTMTVPPIVQDGSGAIKATITFGNHDSLFSAYQLNERWRGVRVEVFEAWLDAAGELQVRRRIDGRGGRCKLGPMEFSGEVVGGGEYVQALRLLAEDVIPFPPPMTATTITWNGATYRIDQGRNL